MYRSVDQNNFHSEFAATVADSRRQRHAGGIGQVTNVVAQIDGFAIDKSPRGLETLVNTLTAINVRRKDCNRITDEMLFGGARLATGRFPSRLFVGVLNTELVAVEAVILREDGRLRRFGIDLARQQSFQSFDSLFEFLVLCSELLILVGQLSKSLRQLSDLQISRISFWCSGVRHDEDVTNLTNRGNPNRKWAATIRFGGFCASHVTDGTVRADFTTIQTNGSRGRHDFRFP